MKISISKNSDPNYLASIVKCPAIKEHPNADKLSLVEVFGNEIIIQKGIYEEGEKLVYFPVECCIDKAFLSWANLLDKAELNRDPKIKGFFGKQCRVKAIKLREVPSQGFVFKVSKLAEYYEIEESVFKNGSSFDTVGEHLLVEKYIKKSQVQQTQNVNKRRKTFSKIIKPLPRPVRKFLNKGYDKVEDLLKQPTIADSVVRGKFKFHYKTEQLGKNIFLLEPDDIITVSEKMHGASAVYANMECKRKFGTLRKLVGLPSTEQKIIYSSRNRIRNSKFEDESIWGDIYRRIQSKTTCKIPPNFIVYGELIGWSSEGKNVQKDYDYGCPKGRVGFRVYRVVGIEPNGEPFELDAVDLVSFCDENGLLTVPFHYHGVAKDLFDIPVDDDWSNNFLARLKKEYFRDKCVFCANKVVNEGVVVRIESKVNVPTFKFKNPDFVIKESASRDKGEADMEEDS